MPRPRPFRSASLLVLSACALLGSAGCDRGDHPGQIGLTAPTFAVSDGQTSVDLAKLRGRVVVLNFWASWCPPCLEELPSLNSMQRQLPQVNVVGMSIDQNKEAYASFIKRHPAAFPTVDDVAQHSSALYNTSRPPETFVIDKSGVIRRKFIGPQDWTSPEIIDFLKKLSA